MEKSNAHSKAINSVAYSPDGKTIVSGSLDQTLKVWDAGARFLCLTPGLSAAIGTPSGPKRVWSCTLDPPDLLTRGLHTHTPPSGTFDLVEKRTGSGAAIDAAGEVAERDGSTLRLKEGGAFYAPSPLQCVAVHWPKLVAGAQSGELYHLEVQ